MTTLLRVPVRYLAMHSSGPDDDVEPNIRPVEEAYEIDPGSAALVLVDAWDKNPTRSHAEATARVMRERIAPLLPAVRTAGIPVIHAPSPRIAREYPQWRRRFSSRPPRRAAGSADWPPPELRRPEGAYAKCRRRPAETWPGWDGQDHLDAIHASVAPEPDDHVVATGDELHELFSQRRVPFPFYAGFATNFRMLDRDDGVLAMGARVPAGPAARLHGRHRDARHP